MSELPSLATVRAKLDRAHHHAIDLERSFQAWMDGNHFALRHDYYADTGWNEIRVETFHEPPTTELALILGDMLTAARGALDYLVWQLVLRHGVEQPGRHSQFPVVLDEAKWPQAVSTQLKGVAPDWQDAIAKLQPFHLDEPSHHLLSALETMNNLNKHRTIPAGIYYPRPFKVPITTVPGMEYQFESTDQRFEDGAVIFRARSKDKAKLTFGNVDLRLRVGFDDGTGQEWDNEVMLKWIRDAIDAFDVAFTA